MIAGVLNRQNKGAFVVYPSTVTCVVVPGTAAHSNHVNRATLG